MAIKIQGTTVVDDSRELQNIASLDATTITTISNAVGGVDSAQVRGLFSAGGTGISYDSATGTISHADTSSQASVNNTGNTFIQDLTLDENGHVTAIGSGTVALNDATITISAGTGISGGGDFTVNQSFNESIVLTLDMSELTDMTDTMVGTDEFIVLDASADRRKAANEIGLSIFNNDAGFTTYDSSNTLGLIDSDYVNARASGGPINDIFYENSTNVTADYTITSGKNAMSAGPIIIDSGFTVTIPSGSEWTVV